jgi:hypothetical protein
MKQRIALLTLAGALSVGLLTAHPMAQGATLDQVLAKATDYVLEYQRTLAGVVSEETYVQRWQRRAGRDPETRTLRSDVLLTRPADATRFVLFRDVFEVDSRQVRDRDERLADLFLKPAGSQSRQVLRIIEESARYNIGDIGRTVNTPTLALVFLDPQYRERFQFERATDATPETIKAGDTSPELPAALAPAADAWVISYRETARDTMIGTGNGGRLPASGRFWVEAATGRVLVTELELRDDAVDAVVDVWYENAPAVGLLVPTVMRERYRQPRRGSVIEGEATYSRVRRFQVTSTEAVQDPKQ